MNDLERIAIEHDCAKLVAKFHVMVDRWDHQGMVELFAEDGIFDHLFLGPLKGHARIKEYFDAKDTSSVTQHITTNIVIDVIDADHAEGTAYFTFYGSPPDTKPPAELEGPMNTGMYTDRFVRTPKGWRFAYRRSQLIFRAPHFHKYVLLAKDVKR